MIIENVEDYATTEELPISTKVTSSGDESAHDHSFVEIFYVISGEIPHRLDDKKTENLKIGDAVLIMPGHYHAFLREKHHECSHRDIIIRKNFFKEVCDFIGPSIYKKFLNGELPCQIKFPTDTMNYIEREVGVINKMLPTVLSEKSAIVRTFGVTLVQPFLTYKTEEHFSDFPTWFKDLLSYFSVIQYLQQGLPKILEQFNYDRKYLCRVFKKYMGITMTDYLNHVRLDYAMNMIQNTDKNVLDIAQELGFSSVSYFNVIFKKRYGITPLEARHKK